MVVRRTDKGDIGLTAAAWLEDRTTTTYQPSHLRPAATARRLRATPPPPPVFAARTLAPALAGAANSRVASVPSPRLALRGLDVQDNPFARQRGAVGASFWNALAFAGLFASVLIGRVIVQAGQEGAQAVAPRAAAATALPAMASQGPTGAAPQDSGAGGVGINALVPGAERVSQEQPAAEPIPAAATESEAQPAAADKKPAQPAAAAPGTSTSQPTDAAQPSAAPARSRRAAATPATASAQPTATESQPAAAHGSARGKHSDGSTHAHRGHAARPRAEALDWRQETPDAAPRSEPAPLPAAKPSVADPSAALGTLRINSRPWSQVFIDGRLVGNTPQLGLRLPAGRYTVRLANPELGMTKTLIVNVAAGEFVSRVETLEEP